MLYCSLVDADAGTDQMLAAYMLDTSDGTFTRYMQMVVYPEPTSLYSTDDPRCWRNVCDDRTWHVEQLVQEWQAKYRNLEWLGMPGNMKWPSVLVYDDEPDGFLSEECVKIRDIYREHGWPDNYRSAECRVTVQSYWDNKHNTVHG